MVLTGPGCGAGFPACTRHPLPPRYARSPFRWGRAFPAPLFCARHVGQPEPVRPRWAPFSRRAGCAGRGRRCMGAPPVRPSHRLANGEKGRRQASPLRAYVGGRHSQPCRGGREHRPRAVSRAGASAAKGKYEGDEAQEEQEESSPDHAPERRPDERPFPPGAGVVQREGLAFGHGVILCFPPACRIRGRRRRRCR